MTHTRKNYLRGWKSEKSCLDCYQSRSVAGSLKSRWRILQSFDSSKGRCSPIEVSAIETASMSDFINVRKLKLESLQHFATQQVPTNGMWSTSSVFACGHKWHARRSALHMAAKTHSTCQSSRHAGAVFDGLSTFLFKDILKLCEIRSSPAQLAPLLAILRYKLSVEYTVDV